GGGRHHGTPCRGQTVGGGRDGGDRRAHRRYSPVRGGDDEGGAGGGERRRGPAHGCRGSVPGPGSSRELARFADGAARPARPGQANGPDPGREPAGGFASSARAPAAAHPPPSLNTP